MSLFAIFPSGIFPTPTQSKAIIRLSTKKKSAVRLGNHSNASDKSITKSQGFPRGFLVASLFLHYIIILPRASFAGQALRVSPHPGPFLRQAGLPSGVPVFPQKAKYRQAQTLEMPHYSYVINNNFTTVLTMEQLNPPTLPLLKPIDLQVLEDIEYSEIVMEAQGKIAENGEKTCELVLVDDLIMVYSDKTSNMEPLGYVVLDFSVKFQRIFVTKGLNQRELQGFKLLNDFGESISFYLQHQSLAQMWACELGRTINQTGFHSFYKPIRTLGRGSFATVYEIVRIQDGKRFAAKVFGKDNIKDNQNKMNSFINQLGILRYINHTNLLKLEGVYQTEHSYYIITDTLNGGNLFEYLLRRRVPLLAEEVKHIVRNMLKGLAELEASGIIHRDIKLQNIMLREKEGIEPVIVDFGLAVFEDDEDYVYYQCGTPGYLAPEVLALTRGQKLSSKSDIFSAGVVMHVLMTGRYLFEGKSAKEVFESNKAMNFDISNLESSKFYPEMYDLMAKMLEKDPLKRPYASECLEHPCLKLQEDDKIIFSPLATSQDYQF